MSPELYDELKSMLESYPFNDQSNFYDLYRFARKPESSRYGGFKAFCRLAKSMGVYSKVVKLDGRAVRRLIYTPVRKSKLKLLVPIYDTCPNCQGSGLVKLQLS